MQNSQSLLPLDEQIASLNAKLQPQPYGPGDDALEEAHDQLEAFTWDGASIHDLLAVADKHGVPADWMFTEVFPYGWPETVPSDCQDMVKQEEDQYFNILAIDANGLALTSDITRLLHNREQAVYSVMSEEDALSHYASLAESARPSSGMRMG